MQDLLKRSLLLLLVLVTLLSFHLAFSLRREITNDQGSMDYLALTPPFLLKSSSQNFISTNHINRATDPNDDWALQSLGVPAVRSYLSRHPELSPAKVAIISSGINHDHEELAGLELDFNTADSLCELGPTGDDNGHGTASAGLISALWGNNLGGYGIGKFPLFICRITSNSANQFVAPLNHAVSWGAKVVLINYENMSVLPGSSLYQAIHNAALAGVAVVLPSGNDYEESISSSDIAAHPDIFVVGAHDHLGNRRPFSQYQSNPNLKQVDFLAPGGEIVTPWWKHQGQNNLYRWFGGTSSAGPLGAGALAAMFTLNPNLTLAEAKTVLCSGATDHDLNLADGDEDGCGNLNLARSFAHPLLGLVNLSPYFTSVPLDWRPLTPGISYQFDFNVLGEGVGATYALITNPPGATINASSGVLTYLPTGTGLAQIYPLTVRASNSSGEAFYYGKVLVGGEATLPFSDNLENKDLRQFKPWWRMSTNPSGRVRIDSKDSSGMILSPSYLELSRWASPFFDNGLAAADLILKTDHPAGNISISFDYLVPSSGHSANILLPNGPGILDINSSTNWGDGLAFSLDGVTWYRAADLSATSLNWSHRSVNLNELLTQFALSLGDKLYLRFTNLAEESGGGTNADRLLVDNVTVSYLP